MMLKPWDPPGKVNITPGTDTVLGKLKFVRGHVGRQAEASFPPFAVC